MGGPWRLHLVVAADKASHLESTMCFTPKNKKKKRRRKKVEHRKLGPQTTRD